MNYIYQVPTIINGKDVVITPFDADFNNNTVNITGPIDDTVASSVNSALRCLSRRNDNDIIVYIHSPGGDVSAGLSIIDTLEVIKKKNSIITVATGMAASMAAIILAAGTKGKRYCQPHAEVMLHQPLAGATGQASDISIHCEHILKVKNIINAILSNYTGQPLDRIIETLDRDCFFDAEDIVKFGVCDYIADPFENN